MANVGDSRAVLAEAGAPGELPTARDLSQDQTPFRWDYNNNPVLSSLKLPYTNHNILVVGVAQRVVWWTAAVCTAVARWLLPCCLQPTVLCFRAAAPDGRLHAHGCACPAAPPPRAHPPLPLALHRLDECLRVLQAGARVMTLDQLEGLKDPSLPCWTNEADCDGDPPRLWSPAGLFPGTAFTRSIGDAAAEDIGVIADPGAGPGAAPAPAPGAAATAA